MSCDVTVDVCDMFQLTCDQFGRVMDVAGGAMDLFSQSAEDFLGLKAAHFIPALKLPTDIDNIPKVGLPPLLHLTQPRHR